MNNYLITTDKQSISIKNILLKHSGMKEGEFSIFLPSIHEWYNGRERGYVIQLNSDENQLNVAFYEHRNSDSIHILVWAQGTFNPVSIYNADFSGLAFEENKWGTYCHFHYGNYYDAASEIISILHQFRDNPDEFVDTLYKNRGIKDGY